ncbi:MAG: hypothetical protein Kow0077_12650 [Anaerolineae bacterium]
MPFLLLTRGDPIGLDLLKKLVDHRYGGSPPAMDSLRVTHEGWSKGRVGPLPLRASVRAVATYRFPFQMKWEFEVTMLGFLRSRYTTTFDGEVVYEEQRARVQRITDPAQVESARARAWSEAVYYVSPLIADHAIEVKALEGNAFRAIAPGFPDLAAVVRLAEDNTLQAVEIERVDPNDGLRKLQRIVPEGGLIRVDGMLMPARMQRLWGDDLFMSLSPVNVELNPALDDSEFRLEAQDLLAVLDEDDDSQTGDSPA